MESNVANVEIKKPESVDYDDSHDYSRRKRRSPKKVKLKCPLCETGVKDVSYKDTYQLKKFVTVKGKIISTTKTGVCCKHQRQLSREIKRARQMGMMPYSAQDL